MILVLQINFSEWAHLPIQNLGKVRMIRCIFFCLFLGTSLSWLSNYLNFLWFSFSSSQTLRGLESPWALSCCVSLLYLHFIFPVGGFSQTFAFITTCKLMTFKCTSPTLTPPPSSSLIFSFLLDLHFDRLPCLNENSWGYLQICSSPSLPHL